MSLSPSPPPWPLPPSWPVRPVVRPVARPEPPAASPTSGPAGGPAPVPGPGGPVRTVTALVLADAGARDLLDVLPAVPGVTVRTRAVPGADRVFGDVHELAYAAGQSVADGSSGVVVVQQGGSLEETAWALDLRHEGDVPVVLAADPGDLADAVRVAAAGPAGAGCVVVTRGEIHAARHVRRTGHDTMPVYSSPSAGPFGRVTGGVIRLLWRPPERLSVGRPQVAQPPRVGVYTMGLGDDGELLRGMAAHCDGLVVATSGGGDVPSHIASMLAEPAARIPVVLTPPSAHGGPLPATALDPLKARVLMHLLLEAGHDRPAVLAAFAAADRGEGGHF